MMAPHFKNLVESAIYPALILKLKVYPVLSPGDSVECPVWMSLREVCYSGLGAVIEMRHLINVQDVEEWEEDEDEYMRKNLPSELVRLFVTTISKT